MFLKPDYNVKKVTEIDYGALKAQGVKALLFDLDSTLMASKSGFYTQEIVELIENLKKEFFVAIVSNNKNEQYIDKVTSISDFPLLFNAGKPRVERVKKFLNSYSIEVKECVLIGDRPLTDILCGKLLGCRTILTDSVTADTEAPIVRFVRAIERLTISK